MLAVMTGIMKSGALAALIMCTVLAGCARGSDEGAAKKTSQTAGESATPTPTPEAEPITLADACPEVEAVLPNGFIPGFGKMSTYVDRLNELADEGDTETQNALELLTPAATDLMLAVARNATGSDLTEPLGAHLDGLSAFAKRCKAAGSSALQ